MALALLERSGDEVKDAVRIHDRRVNGRWVREVITEATVQAAIDSGLLRRDGFGLSVDWEVAQENPATRHLDWS